jgi:molybdate transport system permease protein
VLISMAAAFAALIGSEMLTRRAEKRLSGE